MQNSDFWTRITSIYGSQTWLVVLCIKNTVISARITNFYSSQTSPVVLCMQNSVPSIRIASLYGCQPSSVVFGCKTATFGPEQQVSMCPRHHLSFCACKTEWLAPELLVSMGPCPHLWFLHSKQWLWEENYKSLWVPDLTCRFVHAKQRD